jgi:hypothetical protein
MAVKTFHHKDLEKKELLLLQLCFLWLLLLPLFFSPHACFSVALGARSLC